MTANAIISFQQATIAVKAGGVGRGCVVTVHLPKLSMHKSTGQQPDVKAMLKVTSRQNTSAQCDSLLCTAEQHGQTGQQQYSSRAGQKGLYTASHA